MFPSEATTYLQSYQLASFLFPLRDGTSTLVGGAVLLKPPATLIANVLAPIVSWKELDRSAQVSVNIEAGKTVYSLRAHLQEEREGIDGGRRLRLKADELRIHRQKRRFFRIESEVDLRCWTTEKGRPFSDGPSRVILSASGIRFLTREALEIGQRIGVEISLPAPFPATLSCTGRVLHLLRSAGGLQEVITELEGIGSEEQDLVLSRCLAEKRRQLHLVESSRGFD